MTLWPGQQTNNKNTQPMDISRPLARLLLVADSKAGGSKSPRPAAVVIAAFSASLSTANCCMRKSRPGTPTEACSTPRADQPYYVSVIEKRHGPAVAFWLQ